MGGVERIKTLIAVNLDGDTAVGDTCRELPLHVTLIPPFYHGLTAIPQMDYKVSMLGGTIKPFDIVGLETEDFGVERDIKVRKIGGQAIHELHDALLPIVQSLDSVVVDMTYAGRNYSPHATFIDGESVGENESRHISEIWLMRQRVKMKSDRTKTKEWTLGPRISLGEKPWLNRG